MSPIQVFIQPTRRGWNISPLREVSTWAIRQRVRSAVPLGSIVATTFWDGRRESRSLSGAKRSEPSVASIPAARAASPALSRRRRRGRSSGATAVPTVMANGKAKLE
ncbi:MAG: hypothetical protein R2700_13605 [Solirubrobacterales bacterium]